MNEITVKPAISDIQTEDVDILTKETTFAPESWYASTQAGLQSATIHKTTIFRTYQSENCISYTP
jgi:hypothetical protein